MLCPVHRCVKARNQIVERNNNGSNWIEMGRQGRSRGAKKEKIKVSFYCPLHGCSWWWWRREEMEGRESERKDDYIFENKRGRKIDPFNVSYYSHSVTFHLVSCKGDVAQIHLLTTPFILKCWRTISRTTILFILILCNEDNWQKQENIEFDGPSQTFNYHIKSSFFVTFCFH